MNIISYKVYKFTSAAFTLVELLIVIAILAILASISYTIYAHFFKISFESEAMSVLQRAKLAQTEHMADNDQYACSIEELHDFDDGTSDNTYILNPSNSGKRRFSLSVSSCTNQNATYTMTIENNPSESDMKIKWTLSCGQAQPSPCEPIQDQGTGLLESVF